MAINPLMDPGMVIPTSNMMGRASGMPMSLAQQLIAQAPQAAQAGGALRVLDPGMVIGAANAVGNADQNAARIVNANRGISGWTNPAAAAPQSVQAATGVVDDIVAQTARPAARVAGGGFNPMARTAASSVIPQAASKWFKSPAGKAGWLKASAPAIAGQFIGGAVQGMDIGGEGSDVDRMLGTAIKGAGAGAAIGSVVPVLGTAAGAGLGAAGGAAWGYFTGDKTNKADRIDAAYNGMTDVIRDLGQTYGISPSSMQNVMLQFDAAASIMKQQGDEAGLKALVDNMETTLPSMLMQTRIQEETERKQNERVMQLQSQFSGMFSGILGRQAQNSEVAYSQALHAADSLAKSNPQLADLVRMNAGYSRTSDDALMAAYAAQIGTAASQSVAGGGYNEDVIGQAAELGLNARQLQEWQQMQNPQQPQIAQQMA